MIDQDEPKFELPQPAPRKEMKKKTFRGIDNFLKQADKKLQTLQSFGDNELLRQETIIDTRHMISKSVSMPVAA